MFKPSASIVEGRAAQARPLACLLFAVTVAIWAALAPSAQAAPGVPTLTGTNPPSPATALRPRVKGTAEGVIISGTRRSASIWPGGSNDGGLGAHAVENDEFLITIYTDEAECQGQVNVAGTGTVEELEESGVPLTKDVQAEAVTRFYARQTDPADPAHPSGCSAGISYRQVSSPPAAPTFTFTSPASPADEIHPRLIGTADGETTVTIYATADCSGQPAATGSGAEFAAGGIEVSVADNSDSVFSATATLAGFVSGCSPSTIAYKEVTSTGGPGGEQPGGGGQGGETPAGGGAPPGGGDKPFGETVPDPRGKPPAPTLRTVPGYAANDNTPTITGKAPGAGRVEIYGSADCKGPVLAQGSAKDFIGAGFQVQVANDTVLTFYGVSIDGGGDRSACSDAAVYVEDSTAPHTRITSGPAAKTRKRKAIFRFADVSGYTGATFLCKLDHAKWKACRAPLKLKGLRYKRHVLRVKAVDAAGNVEKGMAQRRFRVVHSY